ncbi:hypothetical protein BED46_012835 [Burkholderia contaminans]|uniref:Uncharacterized protein n=1 Tax=Burkholderia contaminans LMG 23361 TaxID=1334628 RepID=A0ABD4AJJ1_9BURK|nr:hypothetical protein WR31_30680 [Burkholderia contaminans LMG 23361]MBA9832001.1 hypothetical protein [Burkholderia contaminans]MBA9838621.1 hypothetical protein [Burkholderia contaminans]MBA9863983.1 hypothetical protein [Burkholderia contaminans]MBA9906233.1 hypothetical protein [Burkholderia contaminans]
MSPALSDTSRGAHRTSCIDRGSDPQARNRSITRAFAMSTKKVLSIGTIRHVMYDVPCRAVPCRAAR